MALISLIQCWEQLPNKVRKMKALIRNQHETITEDMGIPGINWDTGMPLTNPVWAGGPYILVNDYVPNNPDDDFALADPTPAAAGTQDPDAPVPVGDTIVIDGVTYTRTS